MSKKTYYITQTQPAMQTWYFEVVADSEEEAIELIENGNIDPSDYEVDGNYGDFEYDVYDVK